MINKNYITQWPEKRERLKQQYPNLTEKDLSYVVGKENQLVGRIGQRLGTSEEEARNILRKI